MKIIIGLGNPGRQYLATRHNLGFNAVDKMRENWQFPEWRLDKKNSSLVSAGKINKQKIILAKPQTFMNKSGEAVSKLLSYCKGSAGDVIVIHDELDLPWGKVKFAQNRGSAGHKGVQSVMDMLGTKKFIRLRIGIGGNNEGAPPEAFVLGKLSKKELDGLNDILAQIEMEIKKML